MCPIDLARTFRRALALAVLTSGLWSQAATADATAAAAPAAEQEEALAAILQPEMVLAQSCGGAGMTCCPVEPKCQSGLVCNSNNICRTPCGDGGQRCCPGGTCNPGFACNSNSICRTCGREGDICCAGNTCNAGLVCTGGRCQKPCGGLFQACCGSVCTEPGTICNQVTKQCVACGSFGGPCCPNNVCFNGTCEPFTFTCR